MIINKSPSFLNSRHLTLDPRHFTLDPRHISLTFDPHKNLHSTLTGVSVLNCEYRFSSTK